MGDRWVNAVIEIRIPLDLPVDALREEKLGAVAEAMGRSSKRGSAVDAGAASKKVSDWTRTRDPLDHDDEPVAPAVLSPGCSDATPGSASKELDPKWTPPRPP
jgi:hypothetical protein